MAVDTVRDLLAIGIVPKAVAIGDVRIEVGSYQPQVVGEGSKEVSLLGGRAHRGHLDRLADRIASSRTAKVSS